MGANSDCPQARTLNTQPYRDSDHNIAELLLTVAQLPLARYERWGGRWR